MAGAITPSQWRKYVDNVWGGPQTVVLHTVILPKGMTIDDPILETAEIVEEHRYRLPAGVIPQISKKPSSAFAVSVAKDCRPPKFPVPSNFFVTSSLSTLASARSSSGVDFKDFEE